jgi:hypothetical protein
MSNRQFGEKYGRPRKKLRPGQTETTSNFKDKQFDPSAETPPLTSAPHPPLNELPPLKLGIQRVNKTSAGNTSGTSANGLLRSHSLALSDLSTGDFTDGDEDFVNPFADESDIFNRVDMSKPHSSRILKNLTSDEPRNNQSENNSILEVRNRSSLGSMSSRYVNKSPHPTPHRVLSAINNCFCDCAVPLEEGKSCICGELADHLLHRGDGLALFLKETQLL